MRRNSKISGHPLCLAVILIVSGTPLADISTHFQVRMHDDHRSVKDELAEIASVEGQDVKKRGKEATLLLLACSQKKFSEAAIYQDLAVRRLVEAP